MEIAAHAEKADIIEGIYCLEQVVSLLMILDAKEEPPNSVIYHSRLEFKFVLTAAVAFEL